MKNALNYLTALLLFASTQMLTGQTPGNGVTDIDGNYYKTVIIGSQEWMAENLKVTHYVNGAPILHKADSADWVQDSDGAWCFYNNDSLYDAEFGKLYNWFAINKSIGICPRGWKVPADADWETLVSQLGGTWSAGGKIKEAGFSHWDAPNNGATNSSGFTALPGGLRDFDGPFGYNGAYGYFWSTWQDHPTTRHRWELRYYQTILAPFNVDTRDGFSCRCLKLENTGTTDHTLPDMNLYPNPVQDQLTITLLPEQTGLSFQITDVLGKVLMSGNLRDVENTLNLSKLNAGVYIFTYGNHSRILIKQ